MSNLSEWTLMHKNIKVADIELFERSAAIIQITKTHNYANIPIGTTIDSQLDPARLENWLNKRAIPASRNNIDQILAQLKVQNTRALAIKSYGLSLTDQYWLKPIDKKITWDEIDFFQNEFSSDMGKSYFKTKKSSYRNSTSIRQTLRQTVGSKKNGLSRMTNEF